MTATEIIASLAAAISGLYVTYIKWMEMKGKTTIDSEKQRIENMRAEAELRKQEAEQKKQEAEQLKVANEAELERVQSQVQWVIDQHRATVREQKQQMKGLYEEAERIRHDLSLAREEGAVMKHELLNRNDRIAELEDELRKANERTGS